ncbi:oocyte zinc finger protein XlCOF14-like [Littorina saxatilis]|uniref:oocyte zinc finger protein XlCOF14-like n=1 Tax=Littorina saxatilis TaxID=31220 RepID=UPI0038B617BD
MAHGSGDGPTFECEQCGKGYMERVYFEAHSNRHKKIAPHTCPTPTCGKTFKNMVCLKRHMKVCGVKEPPSFQCTDCAKTFPRKTYLTQHMNSHNDLPQHRCVTCLKRFKGTLHQQAVKFY